jgi:hypothetical protein
MRVHHRTQHAQTGTSNARFGTEARFRAFQHGEANGFVHFLRQSHHDHAGAIVDALHHAVRAAETKGVVAQDVAARRLDPVDEAAFAQRAQCTISGGSVEVHAAGDFSERQRLGGVAEKFEDAQHAADRAILVHRHALHSPRWPDPVIRSQREPFATASSVNACACFSRLFGHSVHE